VSRAAPKDYGPVQFPALLGLPLWAFERALRDGLIPPTGPSGRWPASVAGEALARLGQIREAVGTQPDVGAGRAAAVLSARFATKVPADVLLELDRMGLIPCTGEYKGYDLYDGRALERFSDRAALDRAQVAGRLLTRDEVAGYLQVRRSDVGHLVAAHWLEPVTWVYSRWRRRDQAAPRVPLFRAGDLDILLAHPAIDWTVVPATPAGRPSPLARLTARPPKRPGARSGAGL
jgi:hypothetical protein